MSTISNHCYVYLYISALGPSVGRQPLRVNHCLFRISNVSVLCGYVSVIIIIISGLKVVATLCLPVVDTCCRSLGTVFVSREKCNLWESHGRHQFVSSRRSAALPLMTDKQVNELATPLVC